MVGPTKIMAEWSHYFWLRLTNFIRHLQVNYARIIIANPLNKVDTLYTV